MAKVTIEAELQALTKVKPKAKEERQEYLARLAEAIGELTDTQWGDVSTEAQNWSNAASKAISDEKDIPDFTKDAAPAKPEKEPAKPAAAKKTASAPAKPAPAAPKKTASAPAPAPKKTASAKAPAPQEKGIKVRIKEFVMADTAISVDDLMTKLQKGGGKMSKFTVANIRAEFRHSLKVLSANGHLKGLSL